MKVPFLRSRQDEGEAFDMTPVIDVVFLLIIFFMLVCQFIAAEAFKVQVPRQIASAVTPHDQQQVFTLTVMPDEGKALYAAGSDRLNCADSADIAALIAAAIDDHYRNASLDETKIVRLRCDQSVTFGQVRPVLEGISKSCATDVDWAARNE